MLRKYPLLFIITFLSLLLSASVFAQDSDHVIYEGRTYSLSDLYRIALERAERIQIAEENLRIAELTKDKALSVLIPQVSAFGDYKRYSEEKFYEESLIQPESTTVLGMKLNQSVTLNGKELIALQMSKDNIKKREYDLYAAKEEYLFSVASAYFDVLKGMQVLEIAKANVERLLKHRDSVSIRLKIEEVAKTDLYRAEAELSQSHADLISSKNNLRLAKALLGRIVGLPGAFEIRSLEFQDISTVFDTKVETLIQQGLSNRAEIKALELLKKTAEDQVRIKKSDYFPTLSAEAGYLRQDQDPSSSYISKDSIYVGLSLGFLVFDGGLRKAQIRESIAEKRQAALTLEDMKKQIVLEVEQVYLELLTHKSILRSLEDQLKFARENFNAVSEQFKHGLANSVDVMDANTLLVTSQKQLSESRLSFQLAILKIKKAIGIFLDQNLQN